MKDRRIVFSTLRALLLALLLFLPVPPAVTPAGGAAALSYYFDDSSPDRIVFGNDFHEFHLRKTNGSIAAIFVKPGKQSITLGSRWECLWGVVWRGERPEDDAFDGGCDYNANSPDRFSYEWRPEAATLILRYEPDRTGAPQAAARVEMRLTSERWLDMRITVTNLARRTAHEVLIPCDLSFAESDIVEAALPSLPGIMLERAFWDDDASFVRKYPGWPGLFFADMVSIETRDGALAIYPLPTGRVEPGYLGFAHDEEYVRDGTYYHHAFSNWVEPSETYTSPWVRLLTGGNWFGGVRLQREHLGFAAQPGLREKLPPRLLDPLLAGPLYKADTIQLGARFEEYAPLLDRIPYAGLLHPVAWQVGGHDENYPDLLPPDPRWGATEDMAAMLRLARSRGFLVMPYSNPTWWDDASPTVLDRPPGVTVADLAVVLPDGRPYRKCYEQHCGYVTDPWSPFVITRTAQLVDQLGALGPDFQFWDQVGAREWEYDFNRFSPEPLAYMAGWQRLAEKHRGALLMTEMGYGELGSSMLGFHGSVLLLERKGDLPEGWREGWWRPIPWASALFGDKALLYQHDLAPETLTNDTATLTWNLAMGYMLSYNLAAENGGLDGEWLAAVGALQRYVVARYAGLPAGGHEALAGVGLEKMTRTFFGQCVVTANRNAQQPLALRANVLAASGAEVHCPASGAAPEVTGGVYTAFRGQPLAPGDHVIIEERFAAVMTVRHPLGPDTRIVCAYPARGDSRRSYRAEAIGFDGRRIAYIPVDSTGSGLSFFYRDQIAGEAVEHYRLSLRPPVYLPALLR